jgi:aspartate kinase
VRLIETEFATAQTNLSKVALVSAIGSDLKVKGILSRTVAALAEQGINVMALHQTMRQVEMQCIVAEADYELAIKTLHKALVESENHGDVIRTGLAA